jgi:hypothetical protein
MPCTGIPQSGMNGTGLQIQSPNKKMPTIFHYIYVLRSLKDRLFYIGYSDDLNTRIKDQAPAKIFLPKTGGL